MTTELHRLTLDSLDRIHPMQYGYDERGHLYYYPYPAHVTIVDRYNRCANCEQWSPCDIRQAATEGR